MSLNRNTHKVTYSSVGPNLPVLQEPNIVSPPEVVDHCSLTQYSVTLWNLTAWNNENGLYLVSFLILCILKHPEKGFIGFTKLPGAVGVRDGHWGFYSTHTKVKKPYYIAFGRHAVSLWLTPSFTLLLVLICIFGWDPCMDCKNFAPPYLLVEFLIK